MTNAIYFLGLRYEQWNTLSELGFTCLPAAVTAPSAGYELILLSLRASCGLTEEVVAHYVLLTVAHSEELRTRPVDVQHRYCAVHSTKRSKEYAVPYMLKSLQLTNLRREHNSYTSVHLVREKVHKRAAC
jgi:hypothetical protein